MFSCSGRRPLLERFNILKMNKTNFIEFIKELGFAQVWQTNPNYFSLTTDVIGLANQNYQAFCDQLNVHLDDENELAQLSLSQLSTHMSAGKSFGRFDLKTFGEPGDFQMQIFMGFVKGAFKNPPNNIIQYMRDKKIKSILK